MEIENWYAALDTEGFVVQFENAVEAAEGPSLPISSAFTYRKMSSAPAAPPQPTPTSRLRWIGFGVPPEWEETTTLEQLRATALVAVDVAGEALRMAILSLPTQSEEYRRVEAQARAWAAAGYPEGEGVDVPRGVTGWAQAKWRDGWNNRQACDDILATADAWLNVLDTIRDLRLANKEDVRHAATGTEIDTVVADMRADMRALAQQLNLTLTE